MNLLNDKSRFKFLDNIMTAICWLKLNNTVGAA